MSMIKRYLTNTMIGGLGVVLPVAIIAYIFYLIYLFVLSIIRPVSNIIVEYEIVHVTSTLDITVADILTISIILIACFLIGVIVRTRVGRFFHKVIEDRLLSKIPGYGVTKEVVSNVTGFSEIKFSRVVLCKPFGGDTMQTGFIMDRSPELGYLTVFCPTGPNPTSGFVYHLPESRVFPLDTSVDKGVKSILGCGVGSSAMISECHRKYGPMTRSSG